MIIICCIVGPLRRRGGTPKPRQPVATGYGKEQAFNVKVFLKIIIMKSVKSITFIRTNM